MSDGEPIKLTQRYEQGEDASERVRRLQLREMRRAQFAGQLFQALAAQAGANATDAVLASMAATAVRGADVLLLRLDKPERP
jgi:hypothetical protein